MYILDMSTTVTMSEARAILPELLDRVLGGDEVTLTRHGVPVAVMVRPDTLRLRRADQALNRAAQVHEILQQGRRSSLNATPGVSRKRAESLVNHVQSSRSRG